MAAFQQALANQLRALFVTALFNVEIDALVGSELIVPIPAVSGTMDNGLLLRTFELNSRLNRLVSVIKSRQSDFDPAIRSFTISERGLEIGEPYAAATLLTGAATPMPVNQPGQGRAAPGWVAEP
jgi:circadian clock protein KaiC